MSRFPEIEKKPNGISLEKALKDYDENRRARAQVILLNDMLFGPYNDYKEESGLYDSFCEGYEY